MLQCNRSIQWRCFNATEILYRLRENRSYRSSWSWNSIPGLSSLSVDQFKKNAYLASIFLASWLQAKRQLSIRSGKRWVFYYRITWTVCWFIGEKYLDKALQPNDQQSEVTREIRELLPDVFDELSCFLLPHPGQKVADRNSFRGLVKGNSVNCLH